MKKRLLKLNNFFSSRVIFFGTAIFYGPKKLGPRFSWDRDFPTCLKTWDLDFSWDRDFLPLNFWDRDFSKGPRFRTSAPIFDFFSNSIR